MFLVSFFQNGQLLQVRALSLAMSNVTLRGGKSTFQVLETYDQHVHSGTLAEVFFWVEYKSILL